MQCAHCAFNTSTYLPKVYQLSTEICKFINSLIPYLNLSFARSEWLSAKMPHHITEHIVIFENDTRFSGLLIQFREIRLRSIYFSRFQVTEYIHIYFLEYILFAKVNIILSLLYTNNILPALSKWFTHTHMMCASINSWSRKCWSLLNIPIFWQTKETHTHTITKSRNVNRRTTNVYQLKATIN